MQAQITPAATKSAAPGTTVAAAASDSGSTGLSQGAKIGIGVGVAAGGIALIALAAFFIITRRHRRKEVAPGRESRLQISDPLPGSGRTYAGDHQQPHPGGAMSELEIKSKRYEDMVPRQTPRTMV
jgi:hypothetical protein